LCCIFCSRSWAGLKVYIYSLGLLTLKNSILIFFNRTAEHWNNLPSNLKACDSFDLFKIKLIYTLLNWIPIVYLGLVNIVLHVSFLLYYIVLYICIVVRGRMAIGTPVLYPTPAVRVFCDL
jgi:hypothetical protein